MTRYKLSSQPRQPAAQDCLKGGEGLSQGKARRRPGLLQHENGATPVGPSWGATAQAPAAALSPGTPALREQDLVNSTYSPPLRPCKPSSHPPSASSSPNRGVPPPLVPHTKAALSCLSLYFFKLCSVLLGRCRPHQHRLLKVWTCLGFVDQFPAPFLVMPGVLLPCFGCCYTLHRRFQRAVNHNSKLFLLL